jgi:hypothetical protein
MGEEARFEREAHSFLTAATPTNNIEKPRDHLRR